MAQCYLIAGITECLTFEFVLYVIIMAPICIFGIITNTLLCRIFKKMSKLLSASSYILLLSISLFDNLLLITMLPTYCVFPLLAFSGLDESKLQHVSAYIYVYAYFLCNVAHTSSVYVTVVVGVSRYIAVCHPFKLEQFFSKVKTAVVIIVVFVLSTLYHLPPLLECKVTTLNNSEVIVEMVYSYHPLYKLAHDVFAYFICMNFLPVVILLLICVVVIHKLKRERARLKAHRNNHGLTSSEGGGGGGEHHVSQREVMEKNVTNMLVAVLVVFILLQSPAGFNRLAMMMTLTSFNWLPRDAWECGGGLYYYGQVCNVLVALNSSVNVIIFVILNRGVRERLKTLCCLGNHGHGSVEISEKSRTTML